MKSTLSSAQWAALFAAFSAASALADPPPANDPPGPTLHAETRVVQIDVVAADSGGRPVVDLTKADFTVVDEGKHRAIDIFSINGGAVRSSAAAPPAAPMTRELPPNMFSNRNPGPPNVPAHSTVIVLDQVNAFLEDAAYARDQAMSLMKKLPPDERIALYVIARKEGLALLQDYTTDRALLTRSLKNYAPRGLSPSPPPPPTTAIRDGQNAGPGAGTAAAVAAFSTAGGDQPRPPGLPPGRTGLEEKLVAWYENSRSARLSLQAFAEQLALVPGRKSVYWVTQAFPSWVMKEKGMGSPPAMEKPAWDKTITALNEANVAVNTVDSRGNFRGGNPNGGTLDTMQEVADRTGGKAYFRRNDLDAAMAEGIEASRTTYTLGFYLADNERDDKFHVLKVQCDRPGVHLFYRQGYYAGNAGALAPHDKTSTGDLESSLLSQVNSTGVGITARLDATSGAPGGKVDIRLNLDPATLSLRERPGGWTGKIEETLVEQNASGNTLSKLSDVKEFEITTANRAKFDSQGIAWPLSIPLAPGATKITLVVRDSETGHVGSLIVPLK